MKQLSRTSGVKSVYGKSQSIKERYSKLFSSSKAVFKLAQYRRSSRFDNKWLELLLGHSTPNGEKSLRLEHGSSQNLIKICQVIAIYNMTLKILAECLTLHGTLDLGNASQKNCSVEWTSGPQTFFNTSFNAGKARELLDSFLQENFDLESCQKQVRKTAVFWNFWNFFFELVWEYDIAGKLILSSRTSWK